ncbi:glycosyltransferase family 4 protein [Rhizomonospora bruguierae]|uniref:glycosyltransferase family 4 protein n=1 Tax=Rhizomonospora bruguierae TaxID=1581705 RepID=UPI0020BECFED|nr:glycosyltransferase family 4 protein [Micromonospora sp. NBRC 107566]
MEAHSTGGRPLRVALVAPPYFDVPPAGYGGVEAVVADLADALVERGHHVTLLGAGRSGTRAEFVRLWDRPVADRIGEAFPELAHAAIARAAIHRLDRSHRFDVVHDHTLAGPLNAASYSAAGLPTVVTVHCSVNDDLRRMYGSLGSDVGLIAISERQRALAPELNWVSTVYNGLRVGGWPYRSRKGDFALFLGRFHPQKAPHLAIEAAHAAQIPLVLAGKCSEPVERTYYAREVAPRLGPDDRVYGVADAAAKRILLSQARCLLFPIVWEEPFGMVMIEAMACGTPVVALRGGAVPEVVVPGVTGLICEDPAQLPAALTQVGELDPAACRTHVATAFSVDRLAAGYVAAYRRAIAGRTSEPSLVLPVSRPRAPYRRLPSGSSTRR